jgi:hypothetical protein
MLQHQFREDSMSLRFQPVFFLLIAMAFCARVFADDTYTFHENAHVGQKMTFAVGSDVKTKSMPPSGAATQVEIGQYWHAKITPLAVENGSATKSQVDFDADTYDTVKPSGGDEMKVPCAIAGKSVIVSLGPDGTGTNDFKGDISDSDRQLLNEFNSPDQDYFPDKPVSVGDTWDNSAISAKRSGLDANDKMSSKCKLDWVKVIDGKQMAQITNTSTYTIKMDNSAQENGTCTTTVLVDMSAGMIVRADQQGSAQIKSSAGPQPVVTGELEYAFHSEAVDSPAATKP